MVEMDSLGTNYIGMYYIRLSFIMLGMDNFNVNLRVKALSFTMIEVDL
jgi:anaerobic C4-dicarboxylate transporter